MAGDREQLIQDLELKAKLFRREILEMTFLAGSGHPGGSMSAIDIITVLYYYIMRVDPNNPQWEDRDRFILSKGHVCPALYTVLAEKGFFPKEALWTLRKPGSILQGHPDMRITPGVDMSTGSLGQGLSVACGMALAARLDNKEFSTYCMMGDGEIQEGNIWEGALFAAHYNLDNLIAILDKNKLQIAGFTEDIIALDPLIAKWEAFGWDVIELLDGNDIDQIIRAFDSVKTLTGKPKIIIANTIKGKGVSFMEDQPEYHGRALSASEMDRARNELMIPDFSVT
ncbi:MAG: transketolase [Candidatus Bathyarchaeota archaeon]|jgi:transketolase|nr:transketolase [Candidatus Bathyarchaeota archaeon]